MMKRIIFLIGVFLLTCMVERIQNLEIRSTDIIQFTKSTIHACEEKKIEPKSTRKQSNLNKARGQKSLCTACLCHGDDEIICNIQNLNETIARNIKIIDESYFYSSISTINRLIIDFDYLNIRWKVRNMTFSRMKNLQVLSLVNIDNLLAVPDLSESIEEITINNSSLKSINNNFCKMKIKLQKIDLSYNNFENLSYVFDDCINLNLLDLSHNKLISLNGMFNKASLITSLMLDSNLIEYIGSNDFRFLSELTELSLSENRIKSIDQNAFDSVTKLCYLNLRNNKFDKLPMKSKMYGSLKTLDISDNPNLLYFPSADQFYNLKQLNVYYSYHCCSFIIKYNNVERKQRKDSEIKSQPFKITTNDSKLEEAVNDQIIIAEPYSDEDTYDLFDIDLRHNSMLYDLDEETFECTPLPDPLMPCENLLEDLWLRIAVWLVSIMGILCNLCVISYNIMNSILHYYNNYDVDVPTFLLTNLASADSLMSIYLLFIAIKDATSRDIFEQSALEWQHSFTCNFAGFLSIVSSVASALCLSFITFERYYAIKNSTDYNKRISIRSALAITVIIWLISFTAATLPLFNLNSYTAYAICLPFDTRSYSSSKANIVYIIGLNSLLVCCFFFICACYCLIFINTVVIERRSSLTSCNNQTQIKMRNADDHKLAWNISLLVFANIICWGPVVYMYVYSLIKMSPINRSYIKILAIFVVPFNSLINPFLYCISRRSFRMYLRAHFFKAKFKRNFAASYSTSSAHSNMTAITNC